VIRPIIYPDASEEQIAQEVERRVAAELKRLADPALIELPGSDSAA
jgi:hypothetical protein